MKLRGFDWLPLKGKGNRTVNGTVHKSLIVTLTGGRGYNSGAAPDLANLASQYKKRTETIVESYGWTGYKTAEKSIINFKKNNPSGKISIIGYSLGGREGVLVANRLGKKNMGIDALVTFDAYCFLGRSHRLKYNNVVQALSFYQQNPTNRSFFGISPIGVNNPYPGYEIKSRHIKVINHDYTNDVRGVNHINIIFYAISDYGMKIDRIIK